MIDARKHAGIGQKLLLIFIPLNLLCRSIQLDRDRDSQRLVKGAKDNCGGALANLGF